MVRRGLGTTLALLLAATAPAAAQPAQSASPPDPQFLAVSAPVIAFTNITVMDGTGAAASKDMTVIVRGDRIAQVGPSKTLAAPASAKIIDGRGKTLTPGLIMMHEHPYYPLAAAGARFGLYPHAFAQLNMAAGVTTLRTAGSLSPNYDLVVYRDIKAGRTMGSDMDVSGPYFDGANPRVPTVPAVHDAEEARQVAEYWVRQGVTGFKVYQKTTLDEAAAVVKVAHAHGLKVAAHICSITADQASAIGIDSLEHGFGVFNDFSPKTADQCPARGGNPISTMAPDDPRLTGLMDKLIQRGTAITMTLQVGAVGSGNVPVEPGALDLLSNDLRKAFLSRVGKPDIAAFEASSRRGAALNRMFEKRGGLLMSGTDPTSAGVIPGFSAQREYKLMVRFGWTPQGPLKIMTSNAAKYLGRDKEIGSIAEGKRADLVLMDGDLSSDAGAIDRIETTFKAGVGYSRAKILAAYKGQISTTDSFAFAPEDEH